MKRDIQVFGVLPDGREVHSYRLFNQAGMNALILDFGCAIYELNVPAKDGKTVDVALGYPGLEGYLDNDPSFGAVVGRIVGPVPDCKLEYKGKCVILPPSGPDGSHCHGGKVGFKHSLWKANEQLYLDTGILSLSLVSPDGMDGYPGEVHATVVYKITGDNRLAIDFHGEANEETPFNPTNHCSFNLEGHGAGYIGEHIVQINHKTVAMNGKIIPIGDTALDLRKPTKLDDRLHSGDPALERGYDNFHFIAGSGFRPMMTLYAPKTGVEMEIFSEANGAIVYSCYYLRGIPGKDGAVYKPFDAFVFEPCRIEEEEPFNPSHTSVVGPFKPFHSRCEYRFSVR